MVTAIHTASLCVGPVNKQDIPSRGSVRVWVRVRVLYRVRVGILFTVLVRFRV